MALGNILSIGISVVQHTNRALTMQPPVQNSAQIPLNVFRVIAGTVTTTVRRPSLLVLVFIGSIGLVWLYNFIRNFLIELLSQMIAQHQIPVRFQASLDRIHAIIPWLIVLPLLIACYSAGSRVLAKHNFEAPILSVLKEMFVGIKFSTLGFLYAFKVIPYFIVPGLAVVILNPIIHHYLSTLLLLISYYAAMIVIFGWTLHLIIPVLVVPIIGVCGQMLPEDAMQEGYALHAYHGWILFFLCTLEIAYGFAVYAAGDAIGLDPMYTFGLLLISLYILIASTGNLYVHFYNVRMMNQS